MGKILAMFLAELAAADNLPVPNVPATSPFLIIAGWLTPVAGLFGAFLIAMVTSRVNEHSLSQLYAKRGELLLKVEQWPAFAGAQGPPSGEAYESTCKALEILKADIDSLEAKKARRVKVRDLCFCGLQLGAVVGFLSIFISSYTEMYVVRMPAALVFANTYPWSWLTIGFVVGFAYSWRGKNGKWKI